MIFLVFQLQFKGVWNLIHVPKEMAWEEFWEKKNEEIKKNDNAHRVAHSSIVSKLHTNLVNHIAVIPMQIRRIQWRPVQNSTLNPCDYAH